MKVEIKVIPNAKNNSIYEENGIIKIYVKKPAVDNKANEEAIELLADYLKIKGSSLKIIKGQKSRNKLIEISDK